MESIDGLGQVLGGNGDYHCIESFILKWQYRIVVHVMNNVSIQVRIVSHLNVVQTQTDHPFLGMVLGPMGTPTAHQVQYLRVLRYLFLEELADGRDGSSIYMDNQARRLVEDSVVLFVLTLEKLWCYLGLGDKASKPPESACLGGSGELYHGPPPGCRPAGGADLQPLQFAHRI